MKQIFSRLLAFERFSIVVCGMTTAALINITVFLRYFLKTDLYGIEEFELVFAFYLYFIGTAYASATRRQVTVNFIEALLKSQRIKTVSRVFSTLITFLVCVIYTWWSFGMIEFALDNAPKTAVWKIPMIINYCAVVIGFILMSIYCFRDLVDAIRGQNRFGEILT